MLASFYLLTLVAIATRSHNSESDEDSIAPTARNVEPEAGPSRTNEKHPLEPIEPGKAKIQTVYLEGKPTPIWFCNNGMNIENILSNLDSLKEQILTVKKHCTKTCIYQPEICNLELRIQKIDNLVTHLKLTTHIRTKRGLLNIIGSASKALFGTLDNVDLDLINQNIDKLFDANNKMKVVISNRTALIIKIIDSENIDKIEEISKDYEETQKQSLLTTLIIQIGFPSAGLYKGQHRNLCTHTANPFFCHFCYKLRISVFCFFGLQNVGKCLSVSSSGCRIYAALGAKGLKTATHVFVRVDGVKGSLQNPYEGPYQIIKRENKTYVIRFKGKDITISIDRLKPAYILDNRLDTETYQTPRTAQSDTDTQAPRPGTEKEITCRQQQIRTRSGRTVRFPDRLQVGLQKCT
ncbi:hypothetical protein ANTRET_LOCUS10, partial [Anthophora retusa]